MKRLILALMTFAFATGVFAQTNNLFWTVKVQVKMDKKLEWEKKIPAYLKTHYPNMNFRAFEVMTGQNTGAYIFSMGPMAYKDLDVPPVFPKGEAAAKNDGQALDALSESFEVTHYRKVEALSTAKPDLEFKYARVVFVEFNIGSWPEILGFFNKIKQVREANGLPGNVNYYRPINSGLGNRFAFVWYLNKMEELDTDLKFEEMYNNVHGVNAHYKDLQNYLSKLKSVSSELWVLRNDLSSPKALAVSAN